MTLKVPNFKVLTESRPPFAGSESPANFMELKGRQGDVERYRQVSIG
jgi:hypothetical protein